MTRPVAPFVVYYRVSTDKQGRSGLGLDAQRHAVAAYVAGRGEIRAEFTEIESGRKSDRPQLAAALAQCRRQRATLVIARLDRLARNVAFISGLMESRAQMGSRLRGRGHAAGEPAHDSYPGRRRRT